MMVGIMVGESNHAPSSLSTHNPNSPQIPQNQQANFDLNTQYYQAVFDSVLNKLWHILCCNEPVTKPIKNRPYSVRCEKCFRQHSKLAHTPFRNMRIPQWMAGWLIEESYIRHPKIITAIEIHKKLGISYRSALNLKRRIQVMACYLMPAMKSLMNKELKEEFPAQYKLPKPGENVTDAIQNKNVVHADTLVLYSMRERYGRKRHKNKGLTSSIYRSEKLGGEQVGTLVHQITNGKWVLLDSIPNLTANTVGPIISSSLPRNTALFTDEGYKWLFRIYPNHRMVNHSKKSRDKRYRYAKDRWCQNGVHNQKSEALNNSIKTAFRSYTYIKPKFSKLYLNEWAFFRNLRHLDMDKLAEEMACHGEYARDGRGAVAGDAKMEGRRIKNDIIYSERCGDKEESVKPPLVCSINTK